MLFHSLEFLIFLPTIFILYWFVLDKDLKYQNSLILFSSYVFYGWWDWRFLSLIALSTLPHGEFIARCTIRYKIKISNKIKNP